MTAHQYTIDNAALNAWLSHGKASGWVSEPQCEPHEGLPLTDAEQHIDCMFESDECRWVVRLWTLG